MSKRNSKTVMKVNERANAITSRLCGSTFAGDRKNINDIKSGKMHDLKRTAALVIGLMQGQSDA